MFESAAAEGSVKYIERGWRIDWSTSRANDMRAKGTDAAAAAAGYYIATTGALLCDA